MFAYLIDWGNGYIGGYDDKYTQVWNCTKEELYFFLKLNNVEHIQLVTEKEFEKICGHHIKDFREWYGSKEYYNWVATTTAKQ